MPQAIGLFLFNIGAPLFLANFAVSAVGAALINFALTAGFTYAVNRILQPTVPKPEDGKYNLKQSISFPVQAYGQCEKGGDYVFLEEKGGVAYHIIEIAHHRIEAIDAILLHGTPVTLNGAGVVTVPAHYQGKVKILTRLGADPSTAYSEVVAAIGAPYWTSFHRGDGVASICMIVESVSAEDFPSVFPNGMPVPTVRFRGARVWDPRDGTQNGEIPSTWTYQGSSAWPASENLALIRLDHLRSKYGGRLTLSEIGLASWINAANVCDQPVLNRSAVYEPRYHGGGWFYWGNRQIDIGHQIDQAAELTIYEDEDDDGKVCVLAGEYIGPAVIIETKDLVAVTLDVNQSEEETRDAARGRYASPEHGFNMVDAAIMGDPSADDERSLLIDNPWVRRHNHMARLLKLALTRANARRVSGSAFYEIAEDIATQKTFYLSHPPKISGVVEFRGPPKEDLGWMNEGAMTIAFEGILVDSTLYAFNAATEEGVPPAVPSEVPEEVLINPAAILADFVFQKNGAFWTPQLWVIWPPQGPSVAHDVEYRIAGAASPIRTELVAAGVSEYFSPDFLSWDYNYEVRLRSIDGAGAISEWSALISAEQGMITHTKVRGRLSLSATSAVEPSSGFEPDSSGASTVYFLPYNGHMVPIYDGTRLVPQQIPADLSLPLDSNAGHADYHQAAKAFDVWAFLDAALAVKIGTGPAWSTSKLRGTGAGTNELQLVKGVWTNKVAITLRFGAGAGDQILVSANQATYLGSFYTSAAGQTDDSVLKRNLFNSVNRIEKPIIVQDATDSWTYSTAAFRQFRGSTANQIEVFRGLNEDAVNLQSMGAALNSSATARACAHAIGLDVFTAPAAGSIRSQQYLSNAAVSRMTAAYRGLPGIGLCLFAPLEYGNATGGDTQTWYGDAGAPGSVIQTGLIGHCFC